MSQCLQIQEALDGLKEPIVDAQEDRTFVEQFVFVKKDIKHQRLFFVLVLLSASSGSCCIANRYVLCVVHTDLMISSSSRTRNGKSSTFWI